MEQCELIEINRKKGNGFENPSIQYKKIILINISRLLDRKLLIRLKETEEAIPSFSNKGFIPFSDVYKKICKNFSINKKEARKVLSELKERGFIEFFAFKGIKLKYNLKR